MLRLVPGLLSRGQDLPGRKRRKANKEGSLKAGKGRREEGDE
jgi:hypothetical protein